jgi:hypothetical protein
VVQFLGTRPQEDVAYIMESDADYFRAIYAKK